LLSLPPPIPPVDAPGIKHPDQKGVSSQRGKNVMCCSPTVNRKKEAKKTQHQRFSARFQFFGNFPGIFAAFPGVPWPQSPRLNPFRPPLSVWWAARRWLPVLLPGSRSTFTRGDSIPVLHAFRTIVGPNGHGVQWDVSHLIPCFQGLGISAG